MTSWIEQEIKNCVFKDQRLTHRTLKLLKQMSHKLGSSVPMACQDWANTKAAYRYFSNPNISEDEILEGHFKSTKQRFEEVDGPVLVLHDTTEITYNRIQPQKIGFTRKCANKKGLFNQKIKRAQCGILMHSSLVVTPEGLPLGLCANKFWTREKFKNAKSLYRKKNATRIPLEEKESWRWIDGLKRSNNLLGDNHRIVHIGDRESDMYDFFRAAHDDDSNFLVRIKVNRRTDNETITIFDIMNSAKNRGKHTITFRDANGDLINTQIELKFETVTIKPSFGLKSRIYPDTTVTLIFAKEIGEPNGKREPIDWKLMTNLEVRSKEEAIEKRQWYSLRWRIEIFFKILKSGCKVDESKLRTANALSKMISLNCIIAWRIFWLTMINRELPVVSPQIVFSDIELKILNQLKPDNKKTSKNLSEYILKIAKLGGYLARSTDPPPGHTVIW
jgi:hypothetical protein